MVVILIESLRGVTDQSGLVPRGTAAGCHGAPEATLGASVSLFKSLGVNMSLVLCARNLARTTTRDR